jgi:4-amino-4-deoxy-L-arabinose transferase-like glycosyltransferase
MESVDSAVDGVSRPGRRLSAAVVVRPYTLDLALVAVVTVLVRLPWVILVQHGVARDSSFYYEAAKSIAAGHGYSIFGHPTAFFPIGWPAFLALAFAVTGPSVWTILVLNLILWALIAVLVYLFGGRMGGRATGIVAALIVAISPTLTLYVLRAYSEALFIPLLLCVCLLLTARPRTPTIRAAALAGICLGFAILVRSNAAPLPLLLSVWLLVRSSWREAWRAAAVLTVTSCLVVAPWIVRNAVVMHTPVLSTNSGVTLWIGDYHPLPPGVHTYPPYIFTRWRLESAHAELQQNSRLTRKSLYFVVHDTGTWLSRVPANFGYLMDWNKTPLTNVLLFQRGQGPRAETVTKVPPAQLHGAERTLIGGALDHQWIFRAWHYTFWVLGALAMVLAVWRRRPAAGLVMLLVVFWILFHSFFFFGDVRFMISVTPLVAAPLAWLLVSVAEQCRQSRNSKKRTPSIGLSL